MNKLEYEVILEDLETPSAHRSLISWCEEQWGERWNPITNREGLWACFWTGRSLPMSYRYCFADERDQILFILRWT
jgi:1,4-alpha-glucan branching enzyme